MLEWLVLLSKVFFFLSSVSGRDAFPKRLSREEEEECIEKMLSGDQEASQKLIEHNLRLVAHIAGKYRSTSLEEDDRISIGTIGLIKAVRTFSPEAGKSLSTYAARCIENEILMALRAGKKFKREVSIEEPIGTDKEGNEVRLLDILGTDSDAVEQEVVRSFDSGKLRRLMAKLDAREKVVIDLRYGLSGKAPMPQREVAEVLGISRSYISRIEKHAIEVLCDACRAE